jgi:hypothetical protein
LYFLLGVLTLGICLEFKGIGAGVEKTQTAGTDIKEQLTPLRQEKSKYR